jgi:uncharacterized membrane protein YfcA
MLFGVPAGELLGLAAAILLGGVVTGLLAGLFGVGGGAVIVPVLYEVFRIMGVPEEVRMQVCVGTSLAIIVPTSIRSYLAHRAKIALPAGVLRIWALPMLVGVLGGGAVAAFAPSWVFKLAFVVFLGLLGTRFLAGTRSWQRGTVLPGWPLMSVFGVAIGLYSSIIGVSGATLSTILLTLYGISIHAAVGLSAGVGVIVSLAGAGVYALVGLPHQALTPPLSIGFVSLIGFALMAPVTSFLSPYGARLAHRLTHRQLEVAFGLFLMTVALRFLLALVW